MSSAKCSYCGEQIVRGARAIQDRRTFGDNGTVALYRICCVSCFEQHGPEIPPPDTVIHVVASSDGGAGVGTRFDFQIEDALPNNRHVSVLRELVDVLHADLGDVAAINWALAELARLYQKEKRDAENLLSGDRLRGIDPAHSAHVPRALEDGPQRAAT